jgi:uncharacterized protein (TIGR02118 family)
MSSTVDKDIAGGAPGTLPTHIGTCHIVSDLPEAFADGFGPHAKAIMADIPNYTDHSPAIPMNEVVVG